jgi:hypothetical protein
MNRRVLLSFLAVVLITLAAAGPVLAAPLQQGRAAISYPSSGLVVSGAVDIIGTATHPNMYSYQLRYAPGAEPTGSSQWVDFAVVQATQVDNGVLGTWNTAGLPDGQYTLALAVWGQDDPANPYVVFVTYLTVNNAAAQPTPTPELTPSATPEPLATAVIGPTPTPVMIEQPATPTPLPTEAGAVAGEVGPTAAPGEGATEGQNPLRFTLNTSELSSAFCTGASLSLFLLLVWALYLLVKASVRWALRQRRQPPAV